ncbi:MAG: hypothetical protein Q8R49_03770 [Rhodoferax sp.]|nr:hypothetical protein [Rhodoferax sp.]
MELFVHSGFPPDLVNKLMVTFPGNPSMAQRIARVLLTRSQRQMAIKSLKVGQ